MKNDNKKEYRTKDFYVAAFLMTSGFKLSSLDRTNSRQIFFVFDYDSAIEENVDNFFFGRDKISAKELVTAVKNLKQLIYSK